IESSPNGIDAFVIKIFEENSSTWGLAFASRFGGSGDDYGVGLDVDGGGNIYLAGHSNSSDLLTPVGSDYSYKSFVGDACLRGSLSASESPNFRCRDVFLTKWTQSMLNQYSIAFTTYLGGGADELVSRVRVVGTTILLAGATQSGLVDVGTGAKLAADNPGLRLFPLYHRAPGVAIPSVHQGTDFDAFVVGFNATGSELLFSTLLGGGSADNINGMAVWTRPSGVMDIIVAGYTASEDFPLRNPAQAIVRQSDGFLARLVYDSTAVDPLSLATSTLMGGQGADFFYDVALVNQGLKWVAVGGTESADAPVVNTTSALQAMRDGWLTVWDESGFTFVDQGIQASTSASSVNLGESVTYQLTLSRDQLGLIDDQPRLWVVLPEDNAQISSSLPGCVLRENIYSCPFVLLATQTVNISITPGFKGSYRVKFGVGGLYADAVPANNRVDTHVTVVHHTSTSASDPWLIGFLILWGVLGLRSGRTVV
ncbi:MAG: SBBP repeat-containing protein, partial [Gammaproteobacteria bacterium]|nr:SBBP repeat-containing protein [Gammaproteobacteria bacterium]